MANIEYKDLLNAGVHFGHLTRKWNPQMAPYIFMEKNGIHIIDLNKTMTCLDEATTALRKIIKDGKKVMFVATKKQAQEIISEEAKRLRMPFVTERWLGGMLTNWNTIRKSLKKMTTTDKLMKSDSFMNFAKRERLMIKREREKMERVFGGIADLNRPPAALFVVDVKREHIAIKEATKLGIPIFALVDTNSDPRLVDYPIPANDDAYKSVNILATYIGKVIEEALMERKQDKEEQKLIEEENKKREIDAKNAKKINVEKEVEVEAETKTEEKVVEAVSEEKSEEKVAPTEEKNAPKE